MSKMKMIALFAAMAMTTAICGCDSTDANVPALAEENALTEEKLPSEKETATEESTLAEESTETDETTSDNKYSQLYLNEAKKLSEAGNADRFALVDVDGDDILEFAASSSEGSWDKDQIFLYTVKDNDIVLLASEIGSGMEGRYIGFYEGENIVELSGAASGENHGYYRISDGGLDPVLSLQWFEDPERDFETVYLVDEKESDEEQYAKAEQEFLDAHGKLTRLDTDEMTVVTVKSVDGQREVSVESTVPYRSLEEISEELK